jgi:hypothetical protein
MDHSCDVNGGPDTNPSPTTMVSEKRLLWLVAAWTIGFIALIVLIAMSFDYLGYRHRWSGRGGNARNVETSLEVAIECYFLEYEKLPSVSSEAHLIDTDSAEGIQFINVLLGCEPSGMALQNPQKIAFLSVRQGKARKDGIVYDRTAPGSLQGIFDPWGNPYHVLLDLDGDGILELPGGGKVTGHRAVIYSAGPDRKLGTRDDLNSWEIPHNGGG